MSKMEGKVLIFSAPSGSGKTTIVKHLLAQRKDLDFSISACTRDKRPNETNGKDYHFLSQTAFEAKIIKNEFIEYQEVYQGSYYGTLKSEIERIWDKGNIVVFDVDVLGGINLKKYFAEKALAIFVQAPSFEVLEKRLRNRQTENEESLQKRLAKVKEEFTFANQFDKVLINDNLETAFAEIEKMVDNFTNSTR